MAALDSLETARRRHRRHRRHHRRRTTADAGGELEERHGERGRPWRLTLTRNPLRRVSPWGVEHMKRSLKANEQREDTRPRTPERGRLSEDA